MIGTSNYKIALVVHDLHENGGHSLYTRVLADALAVRHRVTVFANQCERPADAAWQHQPVAAWRVNALASVQTFPLGLRRWRDELARFDICHAQGFCGGQPNVVTAHICQASYLASLRDVSARTRASLQLMLAAEERFYRRFDGHIIAISKLVADDLRRHYGIGSPISVIPHGVDRRRFNAGNRDLYRGRVRAELGIDESQTVALYVGDMTKAHSHLKSLAAAAPEIQFVIVTRSRTYHWSAPNVRIVGATRQPERYYVAADAFVFPSTYDAFGMVVLEAMASGLAVFCSDRAGVAELITTGRDGVVLSLDEWVEGTRVGLRDRVRLDALGRQAAITAESNGWDSVVDAVERVYFGIADCAEILN